MDKFLVFLGCSKKQLTYLKEIKKLNYKVILIDQNQKSPGIKISDIFYNYSYMDFKKLDKVYKKIKTKNVVNIFTASSQYAHLGCSYLANKLGLKYPSLKNIDLCLNKKSFYRFFKKNNLKIPDSHSIKNKKELKEYFKKNNNNYYYYLKSDYGKSPFYIYKGSSKKILNANINWKKNQFFKKEYILQKKFTGKNLRINIFKNKFEVYNFINNKLIKKNEIIQIKKFKIIEKLKEISKKLKMKNWVLKFDVIINKHDYVVLDIGMDPPSRMLRNWNKNNKNFYNFYIKLYLRNK